MEPMVYVPRSEFKRIDEVALIKAAAMLGFRVVVTDDCIEVPPALSPLFDIRDNLKLFELPDSAKPNIEIDTTDMPNPRYHDRTFPKNYDKKRRAKRRQQKQARRRKK